MKDIHTPDHLDMNIDVDQSNGTRFYACVYRNNSLQ